jgi:hypothetical protein
MIVSKFALTLLRPTCLVAGEHLQLVLERVWQPAAKRLQHTSAYVSIRRHTDFPAAA